MSRYQKSSRGDKAGNLTQGTTQLRLAPEPIRVRFTAAREVLRKWTVAEDEVEHPDNGNQSRRPMRIFWYVEFALIAIICVIYVLMRNDTSSEESLIPQLSWLFLLMIVWMFVSWRIWLGSLFAPFPIILLSGVAFNGGQIILEAFQLNEHGLLPFHGFSTRLLEHSILYVTLGLFVFHAGGALAAFASRNRKSGTRTLPTQHLAKSMALLGLAMLIVALPLWMSENLQKMMIALRSGYFALYQLESPVGVGAWKSILAGFTITGAFFFAVGNRASRVAVATSTLIILAMAAIQLVQGQRAHAAWPVVAYLWMMNESIRKLPRLLLVVAGGVMLAVVFPLVAVIRNVPSSAKMDLAALKQSYDSIGNPIVAIVSEMGGSMMTVAFTIAWVPSLRDFDKGLSYLYALTTIFPNIFGSGLHPAVARGTASDWLVWNADPAIAAAGGGMGFSFIAEAYFNFGWWFGLLALFVIGYLINAFFTWMIHSLGHLGVAASGVMLSYFSLYARGESMSFVRPAAWYVLFPVILVCLIGYLLHRRATSYQEVNGSELAQPDP